MTGGFINRIFLTALISGGIAGIVLASIQQFSVVPMILEAETYETVAGDSHSHNGHSDSAEQEGHAHDATAAGEDTWAPQDGTERGFYTFVTSMIAGIGFALLLASCFALQKDVDWRRGILWGLGGFAAFHLAPALGLPPELPGAAAAELAARQEWWVLTVVLTAGGLLILTFVSSTVRWIGIALVVFPHLLGAPQPDSAAGLAPAELETAFVYVSLVTDAVFWLVLGAITAVLYNRFGRGATSAEYDYSGG